MIYKEFCENKEKSGSNVILEQSKYFEYIYCDLIGILDIIRIIVYIEAIYKYLNFITDI